MYIPPISVALIQRSLQFFEYFFIEKEISDLKRERERKF